MAARSPLPRKNRVRCGAPVTFGIIKLAGNGGTDPAIVVGGDRSGLVDRARGDSDTPGVTDNAAGSYTIHLRERFAQVEMMYRLSDGSSQTITSVTWDSTNHEIDIVLSADTSDTVFIFFWGFINKENDG